MACKLGLNQRAYRSLANGPRRSEEHSERRGPGGPAGGPGTREVTLIAVSKTFDGPEIIPVIEAGQRVFGENRVQEAKAKWPALKMRWPDVELHLIGPLQSNKAADAVQLFDAIHTVDRPRIAAAIAAEMKKQAKPLKLFVQVNTGREPQKAGVDPDAVDGFLKECREVHGLEIRA
jgi:PLP dependent protein